MAHYLWQGTPLAYYQTEVAPNMTRRRWQFAVTSSQEYNDFA